MKVRKLYQVRQHQVGTTFGKAVGYKCRLVPRRAALRIASRLRRAGLEITCDPLRVNITKEQADYLDQRYGQK